MRPPDAPNDPRPSRSPHEHYLVGFDGTPLHFWLWPAQGAASKAGSAGERPPVLIVHGAGEYGERYRPFAEHLNSIGYPAAAIDLRGYGQSGGPRAFAARFSDHSADVDAVARQVLRLTGSGRLHLLGHSMGALVCAQTAADTRPDWIASLTLMSPCFKLSFPVAPHLRAIGAICSALRPRQLFATRAISEILTHDTAIARQHREDPRIVHFMSARLFFEMHRAMRDPRSLARGIHVPTAVFQAGDDRVVDRETSRAFFESLPGTEKRWTLYPDLFHEVLNETTRASVYRDVVSYLASV